MKNTLIISDVHLSPQLPALAQALLELLEQQSTKVSSIYILGDLFEMWLGDDHIHPIVNPVIEELHKLAQQGISIYFMHGNRDFLVGEKFAELSGCQLLAESTVISLNGEDVLLMHGDSLCTDDHDYQAFRQQVRNPQWQQHFLSLPIEDRLAMAKQARETSKTEAANKASEIMDANQATIEQTMQAHNVKRLIHGHTHRPAIHHFEIENTTCERIVLGDWQDGTASYLLVTDNGYLLHDPRL